MERVAVIDFETANHQPGSACQLGLVVLDGWQIASEHQWLIRPQRLYFSPRCIAVHGITPRDVLDAPTWEALWPEILRLMEDCVVVAHNAGFDANVLSATCRGYDLAFPPIDLQCTRLVAKRTWTQLRSHALAAVAEHLDIRFRHHDALEDARTAARILIESAQRSGAEDLSQLEDRLGILRGRIWTERTQSPRTVRRNRLDRVMEPEPRYQSRQFRGDGVPTQTGRLRTARQRADAIVAAAKGSLPLSGMHLVLLTDILGLDRTESTAFLEQLGATIQPRINLQTHYVVGEIGSDRAEGARGDLERRSEQGQPIRIVPPYKLLAMIPEAMAIVRGEA